MGVSIHYSLSAPAALKPAEALALVERMRAVALDMKRRRRVKSVSPIASDTAAALYEGRQFPTVQSDWNGRKYSPDVFPKRGAIFEVDVGNDCEPLSIGLFKYPARVTSCETGNNECRTKMGWAWQFHRHCKTQYASLHGWEHFRRCHVAVVDFLAALRALGLSVTISDEGGYWPSRDVRTLRANVEMMNRVVASAAGALKDAFGDGEVQSPIFAHPQFERLEAEGVAERPDVADAARRIAGKLPRAQ